MDEHLSRASRPLIWGFLLGVVGLAFGAIGQDLLLSDTGAVGPLLGIVIAPKAFLIGAGLGLLSALFRLSARRNRVSLLVAVPASAFVTLGVVVVKYTEFPAELHLVEAQIIGCEKPEDVVDDAMRHWIGVIVDSRRQGSLSPRPNWQQDVPRMLRETPGLVLSLHVVQESAVRIHRWRWGDVWLKADPWTTVDQTKKVFAHGDAGLGTSCDQIAQGKAGFWALNWEQSAGFPPDALPEFLSLYVIKPVPAEYERFLPATR